MRALVKPLGLHEGPGFAELFDQLKLVPWWIWSSLVLQLLMLGGCSSPDLWAQRARLRVRGASFGTAGETRPSSQQARSLLEQIRGDLAAAPGSLLGDAGSVFSDEDFWAPVGMVGVASAILKNSSRDDALLGSAALDRGTSRFLDVLGTGAFLFAGAGTWYLSSYYLDDESGLAGSRLLMRSLALTGAATLALKAADLNGTRPDGTEFGFPSGHASMSMAVASTLHELYGGRVAAPAYVLAGLVGLQRIEQQRHDLADVLFGWTLGWVIGSSVVNGSEWSRFAGLGPLIDPGEGLVGVTLSFQF